MGGGLCVSHSTKRVTQRSTLSGQMFEYFPPSAFKGKKKGRFIIHLLNMGKLTLVLIMLNSIGEERGAF